MDCETTWVIVLNSNNCRIFKYSKKPRQLEMITELNHPRNKLRELDLTSDKPGSQSDHELLNIVSNL